MSQLYMPIQSGTASLPSAHCTSFPGQPPRQSTFQENLKFQNLKYFEEACDFLWNSVHLRHFVHNFLLANIIFLSTWGIMVENMSLVNYYLWEINLKGLFWEKFKSGTYENQVFFTIMENFMSRILTEKYDTKGAWFSSLISCESAQISCPHSGRVCGDWNH